MIIHRPLMLSKAEAETILAACSQCDVPGFLRMKINKFIDEQFPSDIDHAIDELLKRNVKGATRPWHHASSRCVTVPIKTYVDQKPRLKPIKLSDIKAYDKIACFDHGFRFNGVVKQVCKKESGTYYIRMQVKYSEYDLSIKVDESDAARVKFYEVLDDGTR